MRKNSNPNEKIQAVNLRMVSQFTLFSYGYVRQVSTGHRSNEVIQRAIEAAKKNDLDALIAIRQERINEISNQNAA